MKFDEISTGFRKFMKRVFTVSRRVLGTSGGVYRDNEVEGHLEPQDR
jgi:hypothetical protein